MSTTRFLTSLLGLFLAFAGSLRAQDTWEWRSPTPTGNRLVSFAYGHGLMVGVGYGGTVLTSPDGKTWTARRSGTTDWLTRVAFDGTRFLAIGGTSIVTSTDGLTWSQQTAPAKLSDLACGPGLAVAIAAPTADGGNHRFLTSPDGATWTLRESPLDPYRVVFANGVFLAIDYHGHALASTDGATWTVTDVAHFTDTTTNFSAYLAAGNNRFLLSYGTQTYLSTDGTSWREITQQLSYTGGGYPAGNTIPVPNLGYQSTLGFAGGYFYLQQSRYANDAYGQYRSADGETWTPLSSYSTYLTNYDFGTLASGGGVLVATEVGRTYSDINQSSYAIHASTDGLTWTTATSAQLNTITYGWPVYGLGRYFIGGYSSPDGRSWSPCGFEPTHAAGDKLFRFVSLSGATYVLPEISSADGITTVAEVSSDGLTATRLDVQMRTPRAVAFGAGRYVIVGDEGKISTSTDALAWTTATSGTTNRLRTVLFAFNRFIAVGSDGTVLTSDDGLVWINRSTADLAGLELGSLAAGSDRILAATASAGATTPAALALPGGVPLAFATSRNYASLIFFNGTFLATSNIGAYSFYGQQTWNSPDGATWTATANDVAGGDYDRRLATGNGTALLLAPVGGASGTATRYLAVLQTPDPATPVAPAIVSPPVSRTVARGESAIFAVGATGTGPFTYQWSHAGTAIPGATKSTLTLDLVTDSTAGDYTVTITNSVGSVTSAAGQLTVTPPVPLVITTQPVGGKIYDGLAFTLQVTVSGSGPITYQWRKDGVALSGATKATYEIYGYTYAPTAYDGSYDCVVTAPYSTATSQAVTVAWGGPLATISPSSVQQIPYGGSITLTATATGEGPFTYHWARTIGGLDVTGPVLTLTNLTPADTSPYRLEVTDVNGHTATVAFIISVAEQTPAPVVTATPVSQTVSEGKSTTLLVTLHSPDLYTYQWRKNGVAIPGATSTTLTLDNFAATDAADYDVVISAPGIASVTTPAATLTFGYAHLANLSVRAYAGTGESTLIQGFVLSGATAGDVLIRSVGPGLLRFGLSGLLADPAVRISTQDGTVLGANDDWSTPLTTGIGTAATTDFMNQLGALPLTAGSRDSAVVLHAVPSGLYMAQASGAGNTTGLVLNEIYAVPTAAQRLVNLSARAQVGAGDDLLIGGFVIAGNQPLKVLIRGVGPGLAAQGVSAPLANPKITLYDTNGTALHNNDQWSAATNLAELRAATSTVGAFALTEGSNDAALLETLAPGAYTVHVTSVDGSAGIALVEIYAVP